MEKNTTEQCPDIKPTVKTTKTTKPRTPVNTGIDKREAQNNRETIKTILLLSIGILYGIVGTCATIGFINLNREPVTITTQTPIVENIPSESTVIDKPISNINIVHKVSKDYRKYFVSYKRYLTNNNYVLEVKEIDFTEYMHIKEGDTLK